MGAVVQLRPDNRVAIDEDAEVLARLLEGMKIVGFVPVMEVVEDREAEMIHYNIWMGPAEIDPAVVLSCHVPTSRYEVLHRSEDYGPFNSMTDAIRFAKPFAAMALIGSKEGS